MPGISRNNDTAGGDLVPSQSTVFANGELVIVNGDSVVSHSPCPVPASHCSATMTAGSNNVFIGGKAVVNAGDSATCGHTSTGSSTVNVGD
jgi:uncharacterized Zn-binding protein involved in type VI secretion|tara:strand:+ start:291 stop:563 length:273 start_codon:yes stop_codon:yes gene_type:complete